MLFVCVLEPNDCLSSTNMAADKCSVSDAVGQVSDEEDAEEADETASKAADSLDLEGSFDLEGITEL